MTFKEFYLTIYLLYYMSEQYSLIPLLKEYYASIPIYTGGCESIFNYLNVIKYYIKK